ncbi:MAG: hypothetical protein ACL93V_10455 [Candidatus Electrothrix sp. YB6]
MKKVQLLVGCFLVAATAMMSAGRAEAGWTSQLKITRMYSNTSYAWVYGQLKSYTTAGSTYYYCRVYDDDLRDQLSDALANNLSVELYCSSTWQTDSSRLCPATNYECTAIDMFQNQ